MADVAKISTGNGPPESDIDSPLGSVFSAVSSKNTSAVLMLLDTGIPVTTTNAQGESLLFVAASVGSIEIARLLVARGAVVDSPRADGRTPLAEAALHGHAEVVQLLIANGADVNSQSCNGETPLSLACHRFAEDSIARLLEAGIHSVKELKIKSSAYDNLVADLKAAQVSGLNVSKAKEFVESYEITFRTVDCGKSEDREAVDSPSDFSPDELIYACSKGDLQAVKLLLQPNADVNVKSSDGYTPLHLAADCGGTDLVRLLIEYGADATQVTEEHRDSALGVAAAAGNLAVAEYLIMKNADMEYRNISGYTPLCLAAEMGEVEMIKLLLSKGANINSSIASPEACGSGSKSGAKVRSSKNSSKTCPRGNPHCHKSSPRRGATPLMAAALNGRTEAAQLLIALGCDINLLLDGNTALSLACMKGHHEVAKLILENSNTAAEHRSQNGYTLLMEAASEGFCSVGEVLISRGAAVNATIPVTKDTALMIAAEKGHCAFVNLLLNHGAEVNLKNKRGCSALWFACHAGQTDIVSKLCSHQADVESRDLRGVSCLVAALKQGCVGAVKELIGRVKHFPSDDECSRHLAIFNDEELRHGCQKSLELIKAARMAHEKEADLNASRLLLEIEKEKSRVLKRSKAADQQEKKKPQLSVTAQRQLVSKPEHRQPVPDSNDKLEASLRSSSQASVVGNSTLTLSSAYCLEPAVRPREDEWKTAGKSGHSKGCSSQQNFDKSPALLAPSSSTLAKVSREGDKTLAWNSKKITTASSAGAAVAAAAAASGTVVEAAGLVAISAEEIEIISKRVTVPPESGAVLLSSKALAAMRQWSGAAIDVCGADGALRVVSITGSRSAVRGVRSVFAALIQNPLLSLDKQLSTPLSKRGRRLQQQRRPQQQAAQPLPVERNGVLVAPSDPVASSPQLQPNPALPGRQPSYSRFAAASVRSVATSARAPDACSVAAAAAASLQPARHADATFVVPPGAAVATSVLPNAAWSESGRRATLWRDVVAGATVPAGREDAGRSRVREHAESVNGSSAHFAAVLSPAAEGTATAASTVVADVTIPVNRDPAAVLPPVRSATVVSETPNAEAFSRAPVALKVIMQYPNADAASRTAAEAEVAAAFSGLLPWPRDTAPADFESVVGYNAASLVPEFEPELFKRSGNWLAGLEVTHSYFGDRHATRPPPARDFSTSQAVGSGRSEASYWANDDAAHWEESHMVADAALTSFKDYYGPNATEARELLSHLGSPWRVSEPQPAMSKAAGNLPIDSLPTSSEFGADFLSQAMFGHGALPVNSQFGGDVLSQAIFGHAALPANSEFGGDVLSPATFGHAALPTNSQFGGDVLSQAIFGHAALPANSEFGGDVLSPSIFDRAAQPANSQFGGDVLSQANFGHAALPANSEFGGDVLSPTIFDHAALSRNQSSNVPESISRWHPANDSRSVGSFEPFASTSRSAEFSVGSSARGSLSTGGLPSSEASLAGRLPYRHEAAWSYGTSSSQLLPARSGDNDFGMQVGESVVHPSAVWGHRDLHRSTDPPSRMPFPQNQKPPFSNH